MAAVATNALFCHPSEPNDKIKILHVPYYENKPKILISKKFTHVHNAWNEFIKKSPYNPLRHVRCYQVWELANSF